MLRRTGARGQRAAIDGLPVGDRSVAPPANRDELDELSDADIDILKRTWKTFGAMGKWELSQYTHDECSEWKDPQGSSRPISYKDIFVAMGRSDEEAELLQNQIDEQCAIDELFKKI
jgi:hypothetical protein